MKNDRGFTLIELICVCAILGVVTVSIFSFMLAGSGMADQTRKSSALSENSRTAIHRLEEDLLDAGTAVVGEDSKNASGTVTLADAKPFFLIKSEKTSDDPETNTYTVFCYMFDDGNLYYGRKKGVSLTGATTTDYLKNECRPTDHVLCEDVSDLKLDVHTFDETTSNATISETNSADITLFLAKKNKSYNTTSSVAFRSRPVYVDDPSKVIEEVKKKTVARTGSDASITVSSDN